jgi:hypothetical protein
MLLALAVVFARFGWPFHPPLLVFLLFPLTFVSLVLAVSVTIARWNFLKDIASWDRADILTFLGLALAFFGTAVGLSSYYSEQPSLQITDAHRVLPPIDDPTFREVLRLDTDEPTHYFRFAVVNARGGMPDTRIGLIILPPEGKPATRLNMLYVWTRRNGYPASPDLIDRPPEAYHQRMILKFDLMSAGETVDVIVGYDVGDGGRLRIQVSPGKRDWIYNLPGQVRPGGVNK